MTAGPDTMYVSKVYHKPMSADNLVFAFRKNNWYFYTGIFYPCVRDVIPPASLIPAENKIEKERNADKTTNDLAHSHKYNQTRKMLVSESIMLIELIKYSIHGCKERGNIGEKEK